MFSTEEYSCASRGLSTKLANCLSFTGKSVLNLSFDPVPMISSLISELPSRFTCRHWLFLESVPEARRTETRWRDVAP